MIFKNICSLFLTFTLLFSCGVYSFKGITISPDTKTVMVRFFQNRAPIVNPTLSQELTQELLDRLQRETNLRIVNDEQKADLIFEGFISDYRLEPVSLQANDRATLSRFTISINTVFTDNKTEKNSYSRRFSQYEDVSSLLTLNDIEPDIVPELIERLTIDIVDKAFSNW